MDGDGCAGTYSPVFVTISPALRDDFMSLCRSLGINCSYHTQPSYVMTSPNNNRKYISKSSYHIHLYTDTSVFNLPRKKDNQHIINMVKQGVKLLLMSKRPPSQPLSSPIMKGGSV
jgi:hypothetical protein